MNALLIKAGILMGFLSILFLDSCKEDEAVYAYAEFPTSNAFWSMTHCEFSLISKTAAVKVGVFGDTLINGKTYHKLYGQSKWKYENGCTDCDFTFDRDEASYIYSFREEDKKIYIVPVEPVGTDAEGTEYIIYDFNIEKVGDVVSVYPYFFNPTGDQEDPTPPAGWGGIANDIPIEYTVKEIRIITMSDGSKRKAYLFDDAILEAWIEGIGTTSGLGSFNHIYGQADHTLGFSTNGVHLKNMLDLELGASGNCGVDDFTVELTTRH